MTDTMTLQGFRLSPQQRRAWQMRQDSAVRVSQSLVRLDGELDAAALAASLDEVARRHEILRTAFQSVPGLKVPVQVVTEPASVILDHVDLTDRAEPGTEVDHAVGLDRQRPCDLTGGRPLRATLFRLGERDHRLLLSLAPVCADSATLRNLVREIARGYAARLDAAEAGPDSMQYADFSEWQNDWLEGGEAEEGKDYWSRQDLSALDAAAGEGASPVFDCEAVGRVLDPGELRMAEELARRSEVPLAAVFLAAWQSLLARLAGRSEVIVGAVCDGRSYAEIADSLGPFARTLPVLCAVEGRTFHDLVRQVGTALGEAEAWQEYFLADEALGEARFAPCAFELDEGLGTLAAGPLRLTIDRQLHCAERFELRLVCSRRGETVAAELQYDPRRLGREEASRLLGRWHRLLAALLASPEREPADVDLLDAAERRQLIEEWNRTDAPFPAESGIHQLVEARAAERPDAPALLYGERVVTYAELDRRADRLARTLVGLGGRPGALVALCSDRTPETVAAVLAVLKSGAAYVALDPDQPLSRLHHLMEETAPSALLVPRSLADRVPEHPVRVFLDDEPAPSAALLPAADPRRLAYVAFSSGSTGRPKGILIAHRGVVNYLTFLRTAYGLGESDVVLQIPDLTFDSSVRDLLGPLAAGARVVLVDRGVTKDPQALLRTVRDHGVTCLLSVVPTVLRALLDAAAGEPAPFDSVRLVLASGEVLRAADGAGVERVFGPEARLYNQYGPTECTMTSSFYPVPRGLAEGDRAALPVGRPIPNARFYLLDQRLLPVPAGSPGELYIGGEGVALGYLDAPGLTAERFVEDPFAGEPGARLYRTGDLAVYREDGTLEFLGRVDQQVKLRGVRIEPGEIEATLLEHPAVRRAVVVAREDTPGDLRLVAYVVLDRRAGELSRETGRDPVSAESLRVFLRGRLPEVMIPSAFVSLDALPTTPNGKVDRKALPAPAVVETGGEEESATVLTPTEEIVAGVWTDVLKLEEVGVRDDFFGLGGHSLLGTQVILRINEIFQVTIPLRTLFDVPTVEGLARVVDEALSARQGEAAPPLLAAPRDRALPLSFAQQRLWFLDQLQPGNPLFNLGSAVRVTGPFDLGVLQRTLDEIVRRHEALRTTFLSTEEGPVQVIAPPAPVPLPVFDLRGWEAAAREAERDRLLTEEKRRPFDLAHGPLLRALVVREGDEEHVVHLGMHHIVGDAWSMGVLARELTALFEAFSRGAAAPLPELAVQYPDFAVWQRAWLQGEELEAQLGFWRRQLAGAPPLLALPLDRPRPAIATFRGARHAVTLPRDLSADLAALGRRQGVTTFMALLATLQVTLRFFGSGDNVVVGTDVAGRTRAETEALIGFFINQLVLRTDLAGDPSFPELLARVRRTAIDAYAHQDLPFDKLVEVLKPERSLDHAPLFQVKLVLQNTPRSTLELPSGLTLSWLPVEGSAAREDLLLNAVEGSAGLTLTFKYNADLFDATTIARLAGAFEQVLRRVAAEPEARLSDLDAMLAEAGREWRASQSEERASVLEQKLKTIRRRASR